MISPSVARTKSAVICGLATYRGLTGSLGVILALVASSAAVQGGYILFPSNSPSAETASFVTNFGSWNASRNEQPLLLVEATPTAERGEMVSLLYWLWLLEQRSGSIGGASPSSSPSPAVGAYLSLPTLSSDPVDPLIGSLLLGQFKNDLPSLLSNSGDDSLAISGNPSSSSSLSDPPLLRSGGASSPQHFGSDLLLGGSSDSLGKMLLAGPDPSVPDPPSLPEPATLTLLAVGGIGLLGAWWVRERCPQVWPTFPRAVAGRGHRRGHLSGDRS